jgi:hypothetical protein
VVADPLRICFRHIHLASLHVSHPYVATPEQHHARLTLPLCTTLLLCCCRWVAFVEAVQNDTTEKAQEAYNRLLLAVTDMELLVRCSQCNMIITNNSSNQVTDTARSCTQQLLATPHAC